MTVLQENSPNFHVQETRHVYDVFKSYTYFKERDVLLAKITPCFENGKAGIAKDLKNGVGFGSTEYIVLRASDYVLPEILYYIVASDLFREEGIRHMTGSAGQQRVSIDFVKKYEVPLPSLEVQKNIVKEMKDEEEIIKANRSLVGLMEAKIDNLISELGN